MKKTIGLLAACAALSACATPYQPTPFDRVGTGTKTLIVVSDALPDAIGTQKLATNGQNMASAMAAGAGLAGVLVGAVAAGIEANIEAGQRAKIQAAIAPLGFDGEKIFDDALDAALKAQGFELATVDIARDKARGFVTVTPQAGATPGSAVLDLAGANFGYQLIGGGTQWRPFVTMAVKLSDAADPKKVLLDNRIIYNPAVKDTVTVSIPVDERYSFAKIEDIEADPAKAAEGLKVALEATAQAVAQLLR
jgi:hypothetical protein